MQHVVALAAILTLVNGVAWAQTGMTCRFQADSLKGTVWVMGENARRELDSGEGGTAAGRIEIWRDGGKQIFILNPVDQTYYEDNAFRARMGVRPVSADTLTVRRPFRIDGVENVQADLKMLPRPEVISGDSCQRAVLTFSYNLSLKLEGAGDSLPGRVEGVQDFCLRQTPSAVSLPFGHRLELTSGHPQVDAAIADRLTVLKGIPVARTLQVTRRIERGEPVSAKSVFLLSDLREAAIAKEQFEVPRNYRFREPEIVAQGRKHP